MGICMSKVGSLSRESLTLPPLLDRKEIYKNLHKYLCESYTYADDIQNDFAKTVIKSPRIIKIIKQMVEDENKPTTLPDWEVHQIVKNCKKEKDWLEQSRNTITKVLSNLQVVREDEPSFIVKQPNYDKLIDKLKTDFLSLLDYRIKQIKNQCSGRAESSADDGETEGPSDREKTDSSQFIELLAHYGVDIRDKSDRYKQQMYDYSLLYECTLVLKTQRDDFSQIYSCIPKGTICK